MRHEKATAGQYEKFQVADESLSVILDVKQCKSGLMYTLEDLAEAKAELCTWLGRFDRYTGNNPQKYQANIRTAQRKVSVIESSLRAVGAIPLSAVELLEKELDAAFPNAQNKQIVEYNGRNFQRRYWPVEKSRSGKSVVKWGKFWAEISLDV